MVTRRELLRLSAAALAAARASSRALSALSAALSASLSASLSADSAAAAPRRILLLGGTGFIGPHLVHAALERGHQVAMLNRGQREPNQNAADFARVEALRGDRTQPDAYRALAGKKWDAVIDTATRIAWTREAVAALHGSTGRFMYVSSTGVFLPYLTTDIPEDGPVPLTDTPPQDPPSYGVLKAQSERDVREGFGAGALIIRPGYIVGPGDTSDRFTYWPVRVARGGEVLAPGKPGDFVQYIDVRDLAAWMIRLIEDDASGTFNVVGPAAPQTLAQFLEGLKPMAGPALRYTWIDDYDWLKAYPLRKDANGVTSGLVDAIPWVMPVGEDLGHMRISNRKALAAGLTCRPLLTTARDTLAWRQSDDVPAALKKQPRYVLTAEQEQVMLAAWKARPVGR